MAQAPQTRIDRAAPPRSGTVLLDLAGELDLAVSGRFHALVDEVVSEAPEMVVADVTEVGFMDSTMLRELLRAHSALAEAGSRLVVAG
ncbi:MAG: STAS domain-containing protein, partial [Actinobacteria bacterium]|nr:STAS domain-containing protein [Actinomycetota bacterium]